MNDCKQYYSFLISLFHQTSLLRYRLMKKILKKYLIFFILFFLLWLLLVIFQFFKNFSWFNQNQLVQNSEVSSNLTSSKESEFSDSNFQNAPTTLSFIELPFKELTIPYLRTLSYESKLNELNLFNQSTTYSSYLTSYTSEGLKINALLTIPNGEKPAEGWPAIVFIHGYIPPDIYETTKRYEAYVDYLAKNNFIVLKIDLRGHGDSQGVANGAYYSSDYIKDVLHAYSALENFEQVNTQKIGLWGHSMAGNVILRTLAVKPKIRRAVIWAGAVYSYEDWQQYGLSDHSFRLSDIQKSDRAQKREELFKAHGEFNPKSDFWRQVVATNYLHEISSAIQLHHAVNDDVVSINYARDLEKLLKKNNNKYQLFEYESGGHNFTGNSFSQAMARTVEWFNSD